jgi:hypothetical protein
VATNPFPEWLTEVASAGVVVRPDDIIAEARGNLWTFGLDDEQQTAATSAATVEFVQAVVAARAQWLTERGAGPMRFYCWYDSQAGQLRFSLVSTTHPALPFTCSIDPTAKLSAIIRNFLLVVRTPATPLPVWVIDIP